MLVYWVNGEIRRLDFYCYFVDYMNYLVCRCVSYLDKGSFHERLKNLLHLVSSIVIQSFGCRHFDMAFQNFLLKQQVQKVKQLIFALMFLMMQCLLPYQVQL